EPGDLLCASVDCLRDRRLEPFPLYRGLVATGAKRADHEIACIVGGARKFLVGIDIGHHDLCNRYGCPMGISHADDESARILLRPEGEREEKASHEVWFEKANQGRHKLNTPCQACVFLGQGAWTPLKRPT